jgi:hypothetical protein
MNIFKKLIVKRKIGVRNALLQKRDLTQTDELIIKTVARLIANPKNVIITDAGYEAFHIQTQDRRYAASIVSNQIKIANHILFMEYMLDSYLYSRLFRMLRKSLNKKSAKIQTNILEQQVIGLEEMLDELSISK